MLFEYGHLTAGQTVLIHGAGNVEAYAVQMARQAGLHVVATAGSANLDYVRTLGAEAVLDYGKERFEDSVTGVDVVVDTVGGDTQQRSVRSPNRVGSWSPSCRFFPSQYKNATAFAQPIFM